VLLHLAKVHNCPIVLTGEPCSHVAALLEGFPITLSKPAQREPERVYSLVAQDAWKWVASNGKTHHMAQAYFAVLGLPAPSFTSITPVPLFEASYHEHFEVLISPFVRSGKGIKEWLHPRWIELARRLPGRVAVLGAVEDYREAEVYRQAQISTVLDASLPQILSMMKAAKVTITLDSGIGHLAALTSVPHLQLYAGGVIAGFGLNPRAKTITFPNASSLTVDTVFDSCRSFVPR
jgi:hypothetical protein